MLKEGVGTSLYSKVKFSQCTKEDRTTGKESESVIKLGTCNLQEIHEEQALKNLVTAARKRKLQIVTLQETYLKGTDIVKVEDYIMFIRAGRFVVEFLIQVYMKGMVASIEAIPD